MPSCLLSVRISSLAKPSALRWRRWCATTRRRPICTGDKQICAVDSRIRAAEPHHSSSPRRLCGVGGRLCIPASSWYQEWRRPGGRRGCGCNVHVVVRTGQICAVVRGMRCRSAQPAAVALVGTRAAVRSLRGPAWNEWSDLHKMKVLRRAWRLTPACGGRAARCGGGLGGAARALSWCRSATPARRFCFIICQNLHAASFNHTVHFIACNRFWCKASLPPTRSPSTAKSAPASSDLWPPNLAVCIERIQTERHCLGQSRCCDATVVCRRPEYHRQSCVSSSFGAMNLRCRYSITEACGSSSCLVSRANSSL